MRKTILMAMMALMLLVLSAVPALAQNAPADGATDQYSPETGTVTLDFELAIQGTPPADKSFFGYILAEGGIATELTDPDGDGLYTGSMDVPQYAPGLRPVPEGAEPVTLPVQIVESSEVNHGVPLSPEVLRDFGKVLMDEDKTFSTAIVFDGPAGPEPGNPEPGNPEPGNPEPGNPEPGNPEPTTPEPTTPEPTTADSGGGESPAVLGDIDVLPDTGGAVFWALGAGALLIGAGLSAWRLTRR